MTKETKQQISPRLELKEPAGFSIIAEPLRGDYTLTANERAVMWTLLTAAPNFKPTQRGLAKILNLAPSTIQKATNSLQERGYLIIKNPGTKRAVWEIYQKPNREIKKHPFEYLKDNVLKIIEAEKIGLLDELIEGGYLSREERQQLLKIVCDVAKKTKIFFED